MAPELRNSSKRYNGSKIDVFSLGVVLFTLITGFMPFEQALDNYYDNLKRNAENCLGEHG